MIQHENPDPDDLGPDDNGEGDPEAVTVVGDGYGGDEPLITGTRHIIIDGEPLCDDSRVTANVENGRYVTKTTPYPLGPDTCYYCGKAYLRECGSNDEFFATLPTFEEGDWVEVRTTDGETITGRVWTTAENEDFALRSVTLVVSDHPRERWTVCNPDKRKIRAREGDDPYLAWPWQSGDDEREPDPIAAISEIPAPDGNPDEQTEATLADLAEIGGDDITEAFTHAADFDKFALTTTENPTEAELWDLLDRLYKAGYEFVGIATPDERYSDTAYIVVQDPEWGNDLSPGTTHTDE